jgi:O-antigen biosynthesis protein WbqP
VYRKFGKRIFDIILSGLAIALLSPLFAVLALWIKLDSEGPVLFRQRRFGIHRTQFEILKFRTMRVDAPHDVPTHLMTEPDRWITRAGRVLRRMSLDELPQLFQIFTGKMSLVGPRPALWNETKLVKEREAVGANDVLPGLTGLAQVNGRDIISRAQKVRYDGIYAQNLSFSMDVKCLFMTVKVVLSGRGNRDVEPRGGKRA